MATGEGGRTAGSGQRFDAQRRWRASFGALLTLAMIVGVVPQSALGVLGPLFIEEFGISRAQLGAAVSTFALVGGVGAPLAGHVTDRVAGRAVLVSVFALAGLALAGMAVSPVYPAFLAAVVCAGASHALAIPGTNGLIAQSITRGSRGLLIGVKQSGVQLSHLLVGALFPLGAAAVGWRQTLMATAVLGSGGLVGALRLRLPPVDRAGASVAAVGRYRHPRSIRVLTWAGMCMGAGIAPFMTYLPLYSYETLGLSVVMGGAAVSVVGLLGAVSRVFWSRIAERRNDIGSALVAIATLSAGSTVAVWLAAHTHVALVWVGALAAGVSLAAWSGVSMLAAVEGAGENRVGRASGLVLLGFMAGMGLGPIAFGRAVDLTSTYDWGWLAASLSFTTAAVISTRWRRAHPTAPDNAATSPGRPPDGVEGKANRTRRDGPGPHPAAPGSSPPSAVTRGEAAE